MTHTFLENWPGEQSIRKSPSGLSKELFPCTEMTVGNKGEERLRTKERKGQIFMQTSQHSEVKETFRFNRILATYDVVCVDVMLSQRSIE